MFAKLLKHDIKNSFKDYFLLYILMIVFAVLTPVLIKAELAWLDAIIAIMISFLFVGSIIMMIVNTITFIKRRMFSDSAYLNYTLPVKMSQTLLSKVIVSFLWILITVVLSFVCLIIFVSGVETIDWAMIWNQLKNVDINWILISEMFVLLFVEIINGIIILILSMTLVNTSFFKKNSNFYILLIFLLISIGLSFADSTFTSVIGLNVERMFTDVVYATTSSYLLMAVNIVYQLVTGTILYLITNYLLNNKLEM